MQDTKTSQQENENWEEIAEWYVTHYGEHASNAMTVKHAAIQAQDTVLDIGCGSGAAVRACLNRLSTGKVIGLDPTPTMIRLAREQTLTHPKAKQAEFIEAPAEKIPLNDDSVDLAMSINVFHHWSDPHRALQEIYRVLKPTGQLIVSAENIAGRFGHGEGLYSDPQAIEDCLKQAGFHVRPTQLYQEKEEALFLIQATKQTPS